MKKGTYIRQLLFCELCSGMLLFGGPPIAQTQAMLNPQQPKAFHPFVPPEGAKAAQFEFYSGFYEPRKAFRIYDAQYSFLHFSGYKMPFPKGETSRPPLIIKRCRIIFNEDTNDYAKHLKLDWLNRFVDVSIFNINGNNGQPFFKLPCYKTPSLMDNPYLPWIGVEGLTFIVPSAQAFQYLRLVNPNSGATETKKGKEYVLCEVSRQGINNITKKWVEETDTVKNTVVYYWRSKNRLYFSQVGGDAGGGLFWGDGSSARNDIIASSATEWYEGKIGDEYPDLRSSLTSVIYMFEFDEKKLKEKGGDIYFDQFISDGMELYQLRVSFRDAPDLGDEPWQSHVELNRWIVNKYYTYH
ncbi:MAG: hypothetical protein IPP78_09970 [Holophagaceae bacterium]|nr:hypothetical protein [Holophagaceae bacterium]